MLVSRCFAIRLLFISAIFSTLAACGGGGGSGSDAPASSPSPIAQAYANRIQNGYQVSLNVSGTVVGYSVSGTATETMSPAVAAVFEAQNGLANTVTVSGTINVNGSVLPLSSSFTSYSTSNYALLGNIDNQDGTYTVVTSSSPLPTGAHVGDTGTLLQSTTYQDQTKAVIENTTVTTYSVEAHTADSAIFHIVEKNYDLSHALIDTAHERYVVTSAGAISFYSSSYQTADGDTSLNFTPQ